MRVPVLLTLLALVAAGCASPDALTPGARVEDVPVPLLGHAASGAVDVPAAFADLAFTTHHTGYRRGEPTIAVATDGTIFTVGERSLVIRSRDGGATWQELDDGLMNAPHDIDPFIWLDRDTGRLFNSRMTIDCLPDALPVSACGPGTIPAVWMTWTDDQGRTWNVNPLVGIVNVDHQKITTGPPPSGVATDGYPNLVYFVYNAGRYGALDGVNVAVSNDGGTTFRTHAQVSPMGCFSGIAAPAVVAPDGAVFIASYNVACDGVRIARSTDGGATWAEVADLAARGAVPWGLDPMMDVDDAGNVYATWIGETGDLWLSVSTDGGDTWSDGVRVSAPGIESVVFPDIITGEAGRIAIAYVGTTASDEAWEDRDPSYADDNATWHLYVAYLEDALAADPMVVSQRLTPEDDPVQRGCIWMHGGGEPCRNLRDFMDMVEHDGNVYIVYPDGCDRCASAEESRVLGETVVVVQRDGPRVRVH